MNTIKEDTIISTKSRYEVRKANDPTGPAIKKDTDFQKIYDYVWSLCDITKPVGQYDNPSDYIIVEVKTVVEVAKAF